MRGSSNLDVNVALIGTDSGNPLPDTQSYAQVVVAGPGSTFTAHTSFVLGDGKLNTTPYSPQLLPIGLFDSRGFGTTLLVGADAKLVLNGIDMTKRQHALVYGTGEVVFSPVGQGPPYAVVAANYMETLGRGADISPGDPDTPFGTLTIGNLDAHAGFTLAATLGSGGSSQSSLLHIRGNATLGLLSLRPVHSKISRCRSARLQ